MMYPLSSVLCHVTSPELPSAQEQLLDRTVMWRRVAESREQLRVSQPGGLLFAQP